MINLKKLEIKKRTSVITLDIESRDELKVRALAVLLGGYNEFGRSVNIESYKDLKNDFDSILIELSNLL